MGKASELKALWQLSFFLLPILILGIMALPTRKMTHDVELKFITISAVFIAVIIKSEIDKRRSPALTLFFNHVQSIMLAIMFMIILFGLGFLFDYEFEKWTGLNSKYGFLAVGVLYAIVSFLIIWRNPPGVQYVPWILIFPYLVATLVGDFGPMFLALWAMVAITSALGYYLGRKRAEKHNRSVLK
jgi:hypothetical protein